jgi:hypothetical protein
MRCSARSKKVSPVTAFVELDLPSWLGVEWREPSAIRILKRPKKARMASASSDSGLDPEGGAIVGTFCVQISSYLGTGSACSYREEVDEIACLCWKVLL